MAGGISGYGTTLSGSISGAIARIRRITTGGGGTKVIDVSAADSPDAYNEFIAGMTDAGALTLDLVYDKTNYDAVQNALGGSNETWTITLSDNSTFVASGFLKGNDLAIPMDDAVTQSASLKISGKPTFTAALA
jgi:predicted secreted protein